MFDEVFVKEWQRHLRDKRSLSLLVCDIDFFKNHNDTYGHHSGDECIAAVVSVSKSVCRRSSNFAARYGGEEFALVFPETDAAGAENITKEVHEKLSLLNMQHRSLPVAKLVTMSIGAASVVPDGTIDCMDFFKLADAALYRAKGDGRNRTVYAQ